MDCAIFPTYRCNARCGMCSIWQHPSIPEEEFRPELLEKIPAGINRINISGGEPTLRDDLGEIVSILKPKTTHLEISTNGYLPDRLESIACDFPDVAFRISIEGLPELNDSLRGLRNGFDHALRTVLRLRRMGVRNIGFAMTISGSNHTDLLDVYALCSGLGVQLANAVVHNSFYFQKEDNRITDIPSVSRTIEDFICELLRSRRSPVRARVKDWFRAYINLGLLLHVQQRPRPLACRAGTDAFFVDPSGRILACNGSRQAIVMGDLNNQTFDEVWNGSMAEDARKQVSSCDRQCWMTGTAVPAMKRHPFKTMRWVLSSKLKLASGKRPAFGNSTSCE